MKIVSVSGTQDSGKTYLIKRLIADLYAQGLRSGVIVNEDGEESYDDDFVTAHQISVEYLRGGWLGCTLATSLVQLKKKLKRDVDPDFLFLEPSELIVTRELKNVVKMGLRDIRYDVGPIITLIDTPSFDFNWQERPKLLLGQIEGAGVVALSRTDLVNASDISLIQHTLSLPGESLQLSKNNSSSMNELATLVLSVDQETWILAKLETILSIKST
jgi:G3E family GTPase